MIAFAEQLIYRDMYGALKPIAPMSGTNVKLFAVQAPAIDTVPWATPPYIVYRLQSDVLDKGYSIDAVVTTVANVSIIAPSTDELERYAHAVYTQLNKRIITETTPDLHHIRYRWLGTQPLIGLFPMQSVQLYRVVVSFS
jgi:hypothetical protein